MDDEAPEVTEVGPAMFSSNEVKQCSLLCNYIKEDSFGFIFLLK
jgi:hypothetical protein